MTDASRTGMDGSTGAVVPHHDAENSQSAQEDGARKKTPATPIAALNVRLRPIIIGGSALWLIALVVSTIGWATDRFSSTAVLTCVAGLALGGVAWLWDLRHTSRTETLPKP